MPATVSLFFIPHNIYDDIADHNDNNRNHDVTTNLLSIINNSSNDLMISQNPGNCESDLFPFLGPTQLL